MEVIMDIKESGKLMYPEQVTQILASTIYAACSISKSMTENYINIPHRGALIAGQTFPFNIDRLLTKQIDTNEVGKFPFLYRENEVAGVSFPYIEYYSDIGKFHIKKSTTIDKLPQARVHRISNAQSNRIFLDFGDEYIDKNLDQVYGLISYNHKRFNMKYIVAGIPEYDYSGWAFKLDITTHLSKDLMEDIKKENEARLKEEFNEAIVKKYNLKLKG